MSALLIGRAAMARPGGKAGREQKEEEISPAEDLMREHGVVRRLFLVYDEARRRIEGSQALPVEPVADAAGIVRRFVEDYHEKLEEDFLFPRFEQARQLTELVHVLRVQHEAGRKLTERIQRVAAGPAARTDAGRREMAEAMRAFVRAYQPHTAREDTVLFPAFRKLVGDKRYQELGAEFEARERALFGERGFEGVVDRVAKIEQSLGIYDLAQFTPRI